MSGHCAVRVHPAQLRRALRTTRALPTPIPSCAVSAWRGGQPALGVARPMTLPRRAGLYMVRTDSREADAVRKLTFGMNLSLDGYIAAPGDDIGWSVPSDELFQWWSDRVGATGLALYGRKLWETMSSHWPAAGGTCRRWCSPRRPARSTGTPAWSPATRSPRSPGLRPRTAARWTSAVPHSLRRPCAPG